MKTLTKEALADLLKPAEAPCVSLYQPTHRTKPDSLENPIRYKNLLKEVEDSLKAKHGDREVAGLLKQFHTLAEDRNFWQHQRGGLAVFAAGERFEVFSLERAVKELVVVADSFHLKPLLRMVQSADRYQVLCLDRGRAMMYEGNRDELHPLDLGDMPATLEEALGSQLTEEQLRVGSYGTGAQGSAMYHGQGGKKDEVDIDAERFFRVIDREVLERFSKPSGLPLILAALPEHHAEFRRGSHNSQLQAEGVMKNPQALSGDQLREAVWEVVEPKYHERLAQMTNDYNTAASRERGSANLHEVAKAVVAARVGILLIEADREIPGRFDPATGDVELARSIADPEIDDLIDDLAEAVLRSDGEVVVVPADKMPTKTGVAAIYRY